jgi:hypothetical protein
VEALSHWKKVKEMEEHHGKDQAEFKGCMDKQKSYADKNRTHREFKVGKACVFKSKV